MIWAGARERQSKSDVYALMECVHFQRNQSLIVIHAEDPIEFSLDRTVKDGVG